MQSIKKVLVPTDFSENAGFAYKHSRAIAERFNATVDFIHVIPTIKYFNESIAQLGGPLDMEGEIYPTLQKEATRKLEELMNQYLPEEHCGKAICKIGRKPSSRIVDYAKKEGYDLIVVASKGEHETHLLRGSVTEKLIRHSEIPVLSVDKNLTSDGLDRILIPTDGSQLSFSALPLALSLAETYKARIIFYHAVELYGKEIEREEGDASPKETIVNRLRDYLEDNQRDDIKVEYEETDNGGQFVIEEDTSMCAIPFSVVTEKSVSAHIGIENFAQNNTDLVVMATHGRSGWAHFFMGSTAEKVSRYLDMPVATVRPSASKLKKS